MKNLRFIYQQLKTASSGTEQLRETVLQEVMAALGSALGKEFFFEDVTYGTVYYVFG